MSASRSTSTLGSPMESSIAHYNARGERLNFSLDAMQGMGPGPAGGQLPLDPFWFEMHANPRYGNQIPGEGGVDSHRSPYQGLPCGALPSRKSPNLLRGNKIATPFSSFPPCLIFPLPDGSRHRWSALYYYVSAAPTDSLSCSMSSRNFRRTHHLPLGRGFGFTLSLIFAF